MTNDPRIEYFDSIAESWDGWEEMDSLASRLAAGLREFGVGRGETVMDVGCGTGNLTGVLLNVLSERGRVTAVDFSPAMVEIARKKINDGRVEWMVASAEDIPVEDSSIARIICYSVWPHFDDPEAVLREFRRVLRPGGYLHIWHLSSRAKINEIHTSAGEAVSNDLLLPAEDTAALLDRSGFTTARAFEDESSYIVTALKAAEEE